MSTLVLLLASLGFLGHPAVPQTGTSSAKPVLDYEYFKTKVEPIFLAKRTGHARCIACHVVPTGAVFQLQPLSPGQSTWTDEQSRKNFQAVSNIIAIPGNAKSPLLIHPLAEDAGGDFFHSGGKHWNSRNDPEWKTLQAWILGQTGSTQARK